jgi:hypothetical protein
MARLLGFYPIYVDHYMYMYIVCVPMLYTMALLFLLMYMYMYMYMYVHCKHRWRYFTQLCWHMNAFEWSTDCLFALRFL